MPTNTDTMAESKCEYEYDFGPKYEIIDQIGSGAIGSCFLVNEIENNTQKVIKVVSNIRLWQVLNRNRDIMLKIKQPNIVKTHAIDFINGTPCMVQDFAEGANLQVLSAQQDITLNVCLEILRDVLFALKHLNSHGLSHKDIKPSNIIYNPHDRKATLVDLDYAVFNGANYKKYLGTIQYSAPEQVLSNATSTTADCYSLGLVMAYLIMGKIPFSTDLYEQNELVKQHLLEAFETNPHYHTPALKDFYTLISSLLTFDFNERISIDEALKSLVKIKRLDDFHNEEIIFRTPDEPISAEPSTVYPAMSLIARSLFSVAVTIPPVRHRRIDLTGDTVPPTVPPTTSSTTTKKNDDNTFRSKLLEEYDFIRSQAKISFYCWIASIVLCFAMLITAMVLVAMGHYIQGAITVLMDGFVVGVQKLFNIREDHYQKLVKQKLDHLENLNYLDYVFDKADDFKDPKERVQAATDLLKQIRNDTKG
jgi:serine/threonine protein kinase